MAENRHLLPQSVSAGTSWRSWALPILAGGISGGLEMLALYPTEFIKTQYQLHPEKYKSASALVKETWRTRGIRGFYPGLAPMVWSSIPKAAVRFLFYEETKDLLTDDLNPTLGRSGQVIAGAMAGFGEAVFVMCPVETAKVRLVANAATQPPKIAGGTVRVISQIIQTEGFMSMYKGVNPTILKVVTNGAIRFLVFAEVRQVLASTTGQPVGTAGLLLSGGVAGAVSVLANNPIDLVKTRMQGPPNPVFATAWTTIRHVWTTEGVTGFYRGVTARLVRVTGEVALVMTLYEHISTLLRKLLTEDRFR